MAETMREMCVMEATIEKLPRSEDITFMSANLTPKGTLEIVAHGYVAQYPVTELIKRSIFTLAMMRSQENITDETPPEPA